MIVPSARLKGVISCTYYPIISCIIFPLQILEPIDEVKAQVCKNADSVSHLQATIEQIKEESKQASAEIGEILCIIKDLKQDLKAKNLHSARKATIHNLKKFIGKSKSMLMSS